MATIEIVELRAPISSPGPLDPRVSADVAYVTDTRAKALEYVLREGQQSKDLPYCWFVYAAELDNPKLRPQNVRVIGYDGCDYPGQEAAFEAFREMKRIEAGKPRI